jgi:IS30 family transposase
MDDLPKKTDLTNLTNKDLEKIEFQINNRPMKWLDDSSRVYDGEKLHWEIVVR